MTLLLLCTGSICFHVENRLAKHGLMLKNEYNLQDMDVLISFGYFSSILTHVALDRKSVQKIEMEEMHCGKCKISSLTLRCVVW